MGETNKIAKTLVVKLILAGLFGIFFESCVNKPTNLPQWLVGKWQAEADEVRIIETWRNNNSFFTAEEVIFFMNDSKKSKIELFHRNDTLFYNLTINNKKSSFICDHPESDTLIFINKRNLFPKRIGYIKPINNNMTVWSDNFDGDPHRIEYAFKKID